jgi:hypothetical protein
MRIELRYVARLGDDQIGLLGGLRLGPSRKTLWWTARPATPQRRSG